MRVERAEPQTIEAPDGFPIENLKFCGGAQEIMAVIQKRKPVALSDFDKGYQHMDVMTSLKGKDVPTFHNCEPYSYEDVYKASLRAPLVRFQYDKGQQGKLYSYFLKDSMKDAFLLDCLWGTRSVDLVDKYKLSPDESNIIVGIFLGYKKKDIRAWFVMALQQRFSFTFDLTAKRETLLKRKDIQEAKKEIWSQFETNWQSAKKALLEMRRKETVPAGWKAKLTTLPSPSSQKLTRKQKTK